MGLILVHLKRKQIQTTKSSNPIGLKKKLFKLTHNFVMVNIENNDPFLPFPLVLLNSQRHTKPYYIFSY